MTPMKRSDLITDRRVVTVAALLTAGLGVAVGMHGLVSRLSGIAIGALAAIFAVILYVGIRLSAPREKAAVLPSHRRH